MRNKKGRIRFDENGNVLSYSNNFKDLTGQKFGRLSVIKRDFEFEEKRRNNGHRQETSWYCICDCGSYKSTTTGNLISGDTKSCGCLEKEQKSINGKNSKRYNKWETIGDMTYGYTDKGEKFIIDTEDLDRVKEYHWHITNGYVEYTLYLGKENNKKKYYHLRIHRLIMELKKEDKVDCDHKNGDMLDNRKENLRICSHLENMKNMKRSIKNTSGYTGVSWNKDVNKWSASIRYNNKQKWLGCYNTIEEAVQVRYEAEIKYHGEFSGELNRRNDYERIMNEIYNQERNDNIDEVS